jgi:probable F420-dependent oxidoreductase
MSRPFRFGVSVHSAATLEEWRQKAARIEELGYTSFLLPDHFGHLNVDNAVRPPLPSTFAALGHLAATTSRLRLVTHVLNNDIRHPLLVAREMASLDLLSGGRSELGLGAGWNQTEYEEAGIPFPSFSTRLEKLAEALQIFRRLFTGERVTFDGKHYRIRDHALSPLMVQRSIPIHVGGFGDRLLELAAREADTVGMVGARPQRDKAGLDYTGFAGEGLRRKLALVREAAGERFERLELAANVMVLIPGRTAAEAAHTADWDPALTREDVLDSPFAMLGSSEDIVDKMRRCREEFGISYWTIHSRWMETLAPAIQELTGI